ncbi:MAG: hypothetical protein AAGH67_02255 [Cyanobacteria bacterium P01_H01_bin.162]
MAFWHRLLWGSSLFWLAACGATPTPPPTTESESIPPPVAEPAAPLDSTASSPADPTVVPPVPASPDTLAPAPTLDSPVGTAAPAIATDTTIMPGKRVGSVTPVTSRADLATLYGDAVLSDTEVPVGEGFTEPGTTVNADTPAAFSIVWADSSRSQAVTVRDFGPAWQTSEGLRVGMPLTELQSVLGDFDLYGFGWDYGGTVVLEGSNLSDYDGLIVLRLLPAQVDTFQQQPEAFQALAGDRLISSDNPYLPSLDLVVDEMIVYLDAPL